MARSRRSPQPPFRYAAGRSSTVNFGFSSPLPRDRRPRSVGSRLPYLLALPELVQQSIRQSPYIDKLTKSLTLELPLLGGLPNGSAYRARKSPGLPEISSFSATVGRFSSLPAEQ